MRSAPRTRRTSDEDGPPDHRGPSWGPYSLRSHLLNLFVCKLVTPNGREVTRLLTGLLEGHRGPRHAYLHGLPIALLRHPDPKGRCGLRWQGDGSHAEPAITSRVFLPFSVPFQLDFVDWRNLPFRNGWSEGIWLVADEGQQLFLVGIRDFHRQGETRCVSHLLAPCRLQADLC